MVEVLYEPQSLRCMTASCRVTIKQAGPHTPHDCRLIVYLQVYVPNLQLPYHYANLVRLWRPTAEPKKGGIWGYTFLYIGLPAMAALSDRGGGLAPGRGRDRRAVRPAKDRVHHRVIVGEGPGRRTPRTLGPAPAPAPSPAPSPEPRPRLRSQQWLGQGSAVLDEP